MVIRFLLVGFKTVCRAYIAINGEWQIPTWLKSRSALPYAGKVATPKSIIEKGDTFLIEKRATVPLSNIPLEAQPTFSNQLIIKVLPGPEFEQFSPYSIGYFFSQEYKIANDSNRMGYRLNGHSIEFKPKKEVISSGTIPGTIQITNSGQPVVLLADAQTVGGYPRIANVISEELDKLAQLKPGDTVRFSLVKNT